jgi:transcriptional regulator with XRE-family HTH domain
VAVKDLTHRIRQARRVATLSQTALAELLGVNRSAVAQWERLGGSQPTSGNLSKLAVATSVQYEWLATGRGRMSLRVSQDGEEDVEALLLQFYAHDEMEERMLVAMRKLEYWQSMAIAEMVESLARGRLED